MAELDGRVRFGFQYQNPEKSEVFRPEVKEMRTVVEHSG